MTARRLGRWWRRRADRRGRGAEAGGGDDDGLAARVLAVLAAHPHGIGAQEIGNELGIDWRRVTAVTSGLVARGAADQIDQDFYPAVKASGRC